MGIGPYNQTREIAAYAKPVSAAAGTGFIYASYFSVLTHSRRVSAFVLLRKTLPSSRRAPLQLGARALFVPPMPLPPEVANGTTVLPVRSQLSRNVLTMVGATYHQMGKPTKTVS